MLHELMESDALVLITGSKYYRGPPFSGATIIPASFMEKLINLEGDDLVPAGLNTFIGKNEIPRELPNFRKTVANNQNPGLALRWIAALAEMEPTFKYDFELRNKTTNSWRHAVIEEINKFENLSYFSEAEDTSSVISVCIRHPDTGNWMAKSELGKVFLAMTLDMSMLSEADQSISEDD